MNLDLLSVLIGAGAAIIGGIIGGWVQGWAWYRFEKKRAISERMGSLVSDFLQEEYREAAQLVYSREPGELMLDRLSGSERKQIEAITHQFEHMGYLVKNKLIREDDCYEYFWDNVIKTAQQLQESLSQERHKRGGLPYRRHYDWLAYQFKARQIGQDPRRLKRQGVTLATLLATNPLPIYRDDASDARSPESVGPEQIAQTPDADEPDLSTKTGTS